MCGIYGSTKSTKEALESKLAMLHSRGPDSQGSYLDTSVALGHTRLSILDLSPKGAQPIYNDDKTIVIVYNGEIYDFQKLKSELESRGHHFKSSTDTEVILRGYEEYGDSILQRLNGQFAFCIYDKNTQALFLARDRLGIKPLYYKLDGQEFSFSSESKTLLKNPQVNYQSAAWYFCTGYGHPTQSMFQGIDILPPGHSLKFDLKTRKLTKSTYWKLNHQTDPNITEEVAIKHIRELIEDSVKIRMYADAPVGAFLSGGLDSSAITALMKKHNPSLNTFSIGFSNKNYDESDYARAVAKANHTTHHPSIFSSDLAKKTLTKVTRYLSEPLGDGSLLPSYLLSQETRNHVTVALSGTGADELFNGYLRYKHFGTLRNIYEKRIVRNAIYYLSKLIPISASKKLQKLLSSSSLFELYLRLHSDYQYTPLLEKVLRQERKNYAHFSTLQDAYLYDQSTYLVNDLLYKDDATAMANSLEVRVPYLDHRLVEYSNKIPLRLKQKKQKNLFRQAIQHLIPEVKHRKKHSFDVPWAEYLRTTFKNEVQALTTSKSLHELFAQSEIEQLVKEHLNKKADHSSILRRMIMYAAWHDQWIKPYAHR